MVHLNMCLQGPSSMKPGYISLEEDILPLGGVRAPLLCPGLSICPSPPLPSFQPQQCQRPPATWKSSSVPTAAASSTFTTVMAMMTVETGQTSLTAVSALTSWVEEEGRPDWVGKAQVPAGAGVWGWGHILNSLVPLGQRWRSQSARAVAFWSAVGHSVHGLARNRSLPCFPSLPPALPFWGVHV